MHARFDSTIIENKNNKQRLIYIPRWVFKSKQLRYDKGKVFEVVISPKLCPQCQKANIEIKQRKKDTTLFNCGDCQFEFQE